MGQSHVLEVKSFFLWDYSLNLELPGIISRPVKSGFLVLVYDVIAEQKVDEPSKGGAKKEASGPAGGEGKSCLSVDQTCGLHEDPSRHCSVNGYLK